MRDRHVLTTTGATVSFGVALALAVVAVAFVVAVEREYGGPGWHWWKDPTVYLVLAVPLVPALLGAWLVRRARHGKNR
jgi:ribose/xylose/arabinose/galactoside ABC-type transport system permease subunit